jgi:hypothetical protein
MSNEVQCGRIGFTSVSDCAERAAIVIREFRTPRAVCLSSDGFVTVEAVRQAIPDELVGVYTQKSQVELWLQLSDDIAATMQERGIRGGRSQRNRVANVKRRAA